MLRGFLTFILSIAQLTTMEPDLFETFALRYLKLSISPTSRNMRYRVLLRLRPMQPRLYLKTCSGLGETAYAATVRILRLVHACVLLA